MTVINKIKWDGSNTKEVVLFCSRYQFELCEIFQERIIHNQRTLMIEPSDTMRNNSFVIPINSIIVTDGNSIAIEKENNIYDRY